MITANDVFDYLVRAINDEDIYFTCAYENIPESLPCIYFRESHFRPSAHVTLDYTDQQKNSTVYIEVFAEEDIEDIVSAIEQAMNAMYYIEDSCNQIDNADERIERYALSFSRIICEGDTLDEMS